VRVALLGLGLVGGSIAHALRSGGEAWRVTAWTPSGTGPREAVEAGIAAEAPATAAEAIAGARLIVLAGPPLACLGWIDELAGPLASSLERDAVVTDVASTKAVIVERADAVGLRFVGGHPMAGRETPGFAASSADLFVDRPWVVTPGVRASEDDTQLVEDLAIACGARPVLMDAVEHDTAVAAVSHLPLVLSAALVEAVAGRHPGQGPADWETARGLAAGGWSSMTRLARGDATMGAGILATNAPAVAARLRDIRAIIDEWIAALDGPRGPSGDELVERLGAVRRRLEEAS
jgi:prephenate dehydrogenase